MRQVWLRSAAVVAVGLMGSIGGIVPRAWADVGAGVWTTGNTWETYTPSENNLLSLRYLVQNGEHDDFIICKEFNSDSIYWTRGDQGKGWGGSAHTVTLKFPSAAKIYGLKFYTKWGDTGRVQISLNAMKVRHTEGGELETVANSRISYSGTKTGTNPEKRYAGFAAEDGTSPVAEDVVEVQLDFPAQQNGAVGYVAIEVIGTLAEDPGELPQSEMVWEAGGYDTSAWEPLVAVSNMMLTYRSATLKNNAVTTYYDYMTDGKIDRCTADGNYLVYPNQKVRWNFAQAITLQSLRVYASWSNGGDGVGIFHVDTLDKDGVWTPRILPTDYVLVGVGTGFDTHEGNTGSNYAILRRRDGKPIAEDIMGIRVLAFFESSACWAEVEAEGWTDTSPAIFDEKSVTVTNDCWDLTWTAKVSSLGVSEEATVNLLTSLDGQNFTVADTKTVTEIDTAYTFTQTIEDVNKTLYYKFETINTKDGKEWRSTNEVASVINRDNATYYWKSGASGAWDDEANWTNSRGDSRLKWPTDKYTTADFSKVGAGESVAVNVTAAHSPKMVFGPVGAEVVLSGTSAVTLSPSGEVPISGRVVIDGLRVSISMANFADGAVLVAKNSAPVYITSYRLNGAQSRMELLSGATLSSGQNHSHVSGDSEILLNGGSVTQGGYMLWSGTGEPHTGRLTFGLEGGTYKTTQSHCMEYGGTFTFRYLLPGDKWTGYSAAPLQPKSVADGVYHHFGHTRNDSGMFRVELVHADGVLRSELDLPLIEMNNDTIYTNSFEFVAFGKEMEVGVPNGKGDYFYWTYAGGDAREPATEGALPTGLRFHHVARGGFCLRIQ
jgi:hypothetical protein